MLGIRLSEPDDLSDEDEVDTPRCLLADLEDLSDATVQSICGIGTSVLKYQTVLGDPFVSRFQVGNEFLRADDKDDVRCAPSV